MCVQNINRARGLAGLLSRCLCQVSTLRHVNAAGDFRVLIKGAPSMKVAISESDAVLIQTIQTDAIEQVAV